MCNRVRRSRSGFTLIEVLIVAMILGIVLYGVLGVLAASSSSYRHSSASLDMESRGSRLMERLVDALRRSGGTTLTSVPVNPLWTTTLDFQRSQGFEGVAGNWSEVEGLRVDLAVGSLRWLREPEMASQAVIDDVQSVRPMLEGEIANGLDDNGNGLIDEPGFCVTRENNAIRLHLTLEEEGPNGSTLTRSWSTRVTTRN